MSRAYALSTPRASQLTCIPLALRYCALMTIRTNTTIRLSVEENTEIEETIADYGFTEMAPFIHFAIKQIRRSMHDSGN